jgi:hypothetical protein
MFRDATHGWWCGARTYPARCRYCGAKIFIFSCNCGSTVIFDSLGWPWPIHDCSSEIIRQVDLKIEVEYRKRIENRFRRKEWETPIVAINPINGERLIEFGLVREIIKNVDIFQKFNLSVASPISNGLLGELSEYPILQITIHVNDLSRDKIHSYTFFIDEKKWTKLNASCGDSLLFEIIGKTIPGRGNYWHCCRLDWVSNKT